MPSRFNWNGEKEISHEKAEAAYLDWLKEHIPELWKKLSVTKAVTAPIPVTSGEKTCDTCQSSFEGYGKECPACRKRRSRGPKKGAAAV